MSDEMKNQKLKEYLEGMRNCPDKWVEINGESVNRLAAEYGIYDNYIVLLKGDYEKVKEDLGEKSKKYKFFKEERKKETTIFKWNKKDKKFSYGDYTEKERGFLSNSGFVFFHICNYAGIGHTTARSSDFETDDSSEEVKEHTRKQLKSYNMTMVFHPWNERKLKNTSQTKVLRNTIYDICEYLIKENIPFCLPRSNGRGIKEDCSKIIYYDPEEGVK